MLSPRQRPSPHAALQPFLDELRGHQGVGGAVVGSGGVESTFHRVARELIPRADPAFGEWLAKDDDATLRAMGFALLASRGEKATLVAHVCDREVIVVRPYGCVGSYRPLGHVAQEFLWAPTWLGSFRIGSDRELLSSREGTELALRLAGADGCSLGPHAKDELKTARVGTWTSIRASVPSVPTWIVVKALARFNPTGSVAQLVAVLEDATMPVRARLAAASGLTLTGSHIAEHAIDQHAAFLDGTRRGLATSLVEVIRLRRAVDALVEPIDRVKTWRAAEALASNAVDAYAFRHPLLVATVPSPHFGARQADVDDARGRALLWVSEHLGDHEDCWSAYRDVAYMLERWLWHEDWDSRDGWRRGDLARILPGTMLASFRAKVGAATARLDANTNCLE